MFRYFIRKSLYGLTVMAGVVSIVFTLFAILPGDAARMTQGQRTDVASLEAVRKEFGLDKPKYIQFLLYINDVSPLSVHKNDAENKSKYQYLSLIPFGENTLVLKAPYLRRSYQTQKKVSDILWETIPNTAVLAITSMVFASLVGIALGLLAALYKDTWVDRSAMSFAILGVSMPSFFAGILIAWLFAFLLGNYTGLKMSGSLYDYNPFNGEELQLKNLVLPTLTLGLRPLSIIVQLTRSSMLDVMKMDYIRTARAKGLNGYQVVWRHALKNAMNPVVTAISGWFASLMAGAFFVEYIFSWNGLGKITVDALELSDLPVVMGAVLFIAFLFVIVNLLVDISYSLLDPRVKLQ